MADIISLLHKLSERARLDTGRDAETAARMFDMLLTKHGLTREVFDERAKVEISFSPQMRAAVINMVLGLGIRVYRGRAGNKLLVEVTQLEERIVAQALRDLKDLFNQRYQKAMREISSHLLGFVDAAYATEDRPPTCPKGHGEMTRKGRMLTCPVCGHVSRQPPAVKIYFDHYAAGRADSHRLLPDNT
jgi:hypothetical protein